MAFGKRSRFLGLLPRIAVSLAVVGLAPAALLSFRLYNLNERALREQVKRTHAVAVRATGARLEAHVVSRSDLAHTLASHPILLENPQSVAGQNILAGTLEAQEDVAGVIITDAEGEVVVRAQWPDRAQLVEEAMAGHQGTRIELIAGTEGRTLLLVTVPLPDGRGKLQLVEDDSRLHTLFQPEEMGQDAVLMLLGPDGSTLFGEPTQLPEGLIERALSRKVAGTEIVSRPDGEDVVAALFPVSGAPWTVVSTQPARVAEDIYHELQRQTVLALSIALALAGFTAFVAYRSLVRPVQGLLAARRELAELEGSTVAGGNEIDQLRSSFEQLASRVRLKQEIGRVFLGRYQVLEVLGEGSMGTVFRGWDPNLRRPVALKTVQISGKLPDSERTRLGSSLLQEAVVAARFSHPNIVAIYDAEGTEEAAYVAMELVEGISLERFLFQQQSLPPARAIPIALAIAKALGAAHEEGMVHRDIKPGNVLLGFDSCIKVTDFGIAEFLSSIQDASEKVFGTPGFLAPETIQGRGYLPQSDLFALGVVLYECLAGRHPFRGNTVMDVLRSTLEHQVPALGKVNPTVTYRLESLCKKLLAKDPKERPENAQAVVEELEVIASANNWRWSFEAGSHSGDLVADLEAAEGQWVATMVMDGELMPGGPARARQP